MPRRRIPKATRIIELGMIAATNLNQRKTEPVILGPDLTPKVRQKTKHQLEEKNLKEKITEENTTRTTESLHFIEIEGLGEKPTQHLLSR